MPVSPTGAGAADVDGLPGALPVAWETIQQLREEVSEDLDAARKRHRAEHGRELEEEDVTAAAQAAVHSRVAAAAERHARGGTAWTRAQVAAVRTAVLDAVFLAGPVQRVLGWEGLEDIVIDGEMVVDFTDRPRQWHPSPFPSEQAKIDWVNQMCRHTSGTLSLARPRVNFDLPDGSRGVATLLTEGASTVAIRRHRVATSGMEQLLEWGTLDGAVANFLAAAVKARMNILIAGDMGLGKTTLMRALSRYIPPSERVATLEDVPELRLREHLAQFPAHPHVLSWRSRESNGERDGSGRLIGEISIADLVPETLRFRASRVMVGEVRSVEAVPMLEVMASGGSGSMCTIHARGVDEVIERLMVPVTRTGMTDTAGYRLIASTIDLIVYLDKVDQRHLPEGRLHRHVSHIQEVTGLGEGGGVAVHNVFAPVGEDPRGVPSGGSGLSDKRRRALQQEGGFDPRWLQMPHGQWPRLKLVGG